MTTAKLVVTNLQQGVVVTGCKTTGPPAKIRLEAAWRHRLACAGDAASSLIIARRGVLQMTGDDRCQTAKQY